MSDLCFPNLPGWQRPLNCSGSARPGARALMAHYLESTTRGYNLGIYNCRTIGGSSALSTHAEGRACDLGNPTDAAGKAMMYEYLGALDAHAGKLGINYIIFDRTKYRTADPCGAPYRGVHPHYDHAHVEMTRASAEKLTLATLRSVVGDFRANPFDGGSGGDNGLMKPEDMQKALIDAGYDLGNYTPLPGYPPGADGDWGDKSQQALTQAFKDAKEGQAPDLSGLVTKAVFDGHRHQEGTTGKPI